MENLERAIILGLILSTGVYGTAWAEESYTITGNSIEINTNSTTGAGKTYDGKNLSDFSDITINFNTNTDQVRALGIWSARYDLPNTNVTVNVTGDGENNDGIHLSNWNPHFVANSFSAYIDSPISDAINISHDATTSYVTLNKLTAVVNQGNGIRANAAWRENNVNTITINENTDITINTNAGSDVSRPTAVWAGDSQRYFLFWGEETKGKGEVYLNGNTTLKLNGNGNYGIFAGKNGSIEVNNIDINAKGTNSYGIAATNDNIIYGTSLDQSQNRFGSTVTLNGDANKIYMVETDEDGNIKLDENGNPIQTEGSKAIYADSQYGVVKSGEGGMGYIDIIGDIVAEDGGTINLDITRSKQNWLQGDIIAYGTQSSKKASVNLTTNAALAYQGDALAANGGIVDVKLGNRSSWAGRADDYQDATNSEWLKNHTDNLDTKFSGSVTGNGTVKIDMGTESTWNVTGQSWVTDLKGNNSYIILDNDENGNGYALHIGKITGKILLQ